MTKMTEDIERRGFKYMIEFPNKFRIYAIDEQSLSSIVDKYGILIKGESSNKTMPESLEKSPIDRLPTLSQCPECASPNIVFDNKCRKLICMSCGLEIDAQNHTKTSEKPAF